MTSALTHKQIKKIMKLNLTAEQENKLSGLHLTEESKIRIVTGLLASYERKNKELEKYRDCSSLKDGWQTSNLAKKQRKADVLSQEISLIRNILFDDWSIEI
jgi:hypothetical protein